MARYTTLLPAIFIALGGCTKKQSTVVPPLVKMIDTTGILAKMQGIRMFHGWKVTTLIDSTTRVDSIWIDNYPVEISQQEPATISLSKPSGADGYISHDYKMRPEFLDGGAMAQFAVNFPATHEYYLNMSYTNHTNKVNTLYIKMEKYGGPMSVIQKLSLSEN